jgi:hypothetical protein
MRRGRYISSFVSLVDRVCLLQQSSLASYPLPGEECNACMKFGGLKLRPARVIFPTDFTDSFKGSADFAYWTMPYFPDTLPKIAEILPQKCN